MRVPSPWWGTQKQWGPFLCAIPRRFCIWLLGVGVGALFGVVPASTVVARPLVVSVWTEGSLTKVFPHSPPGRSFGVSLEACRNEWESFQVVVRSEERTVPGITLVPSTLRGPQGARIPPSAIETFQEHYVFVSQPSGNAVAQPRYWPDALIPMRVRRTACALRGTNLPFWVTIRVPPSATPGTYRGSLTVESAHGARAHIPIQLRVRNILLPTANHQAATAALYYDAIRQYSNRHFRKGRPPLKPGSAEWEALKERYFRFLLDYRICPYDLPVPLTLPSVRRFVSDPRLNRFRLPWVSQDTRRFQQEVQILRDLGVLDRTFYYQFDEPPQEQYGAVRALAETVRQADPDLRRLLTLFPTPDLLGAVEIWCPNIGDTFGLGYLDHQILQERRAVGEETWWYTMCVPRYPYPTWLVDDDAVAHRIFFWMQALYGITGFVYSQVHGWSEDPYRCVASTAGSNGDGLLLYPGEPYGSAEPFPSLRLQVIRDGIEDYECFWLLRTRTQQALEATGIRNASAIAQGVVASHCRRLIGSERSFCRDPEAFQRARHNLLDELEQCETMPRSAVALIAETKAPVPKEKWLVVAEEGTRVVVDGQREQVLSLQDKILEEVPAPPTPIRVCVEKEGRQKAWRRWPLWPLEEIPTPPRIPCPRLARPPTVDGRVDEEEWAGATLLHPSRRGNGLGRVKGHTEVYLGYDANCLYLGARCYLGNQRAEEQMVGLILDPAPLGDAKLEIFMTGQGRRYARLCSRRGHTVPRLGWQWAQGAGEGVWQCETALAFVGSLPPPTPGEEWGLNVVRQSGTEESVWSVTYGDIRRLGRLLFVE